MSLPYSGYRPSEDIARDLLRIPLASHGEQQKRIQTLLEEMHESNAENLRLSAQIERLTEALKAIEQSAFVANVHSDPQVLAVALQSIEDIARTATA